MIENLLSNIKFTSIIGVTQGFWNFLIFSFIIICIIVFIILLYLSKNIQDWNHINAFDKQSIEGKLEDLAQSIKLLPSDNIKETPIQILISNVFLEKIKLKKEISSDEIKKYLMKDPTTLNKIIQDKDIVNWLLPEKHKLVNISIFNLIFF